MYLRHHGLHQFGPGSLCHDVLNAAAGYGLVPEFAFTGLDAGETEFNHGELDAVLAAAVKAMSEQKVLSDDWRDAVDGICDAYLGKLPSSFQFDGKTYTPESFRDQLGINPAQYVSLTSFTHHAFEETFVLEVPDNFSRGQYLQLAHRGFDARRAEGRDGRLHRGLGCRRLREGIQLPQRHGADAGRRREAKMFQEVIEEAKVSQASRQVGFENHTTTDDHLMHIVGLAQDQNGKEYFVIKNSWGDDNPYEGTSIHQHGVF